MTEAYFEKIQRKNIKMFQYAEGESEQSRQKIYDNDLDSVKSKGLLAVVISKFTSLPTLAEMDSETRKIIMIEIKTFIECFETV